MRTGKRYRPGRASEHYDAIVIGSGMGGLANAALLSLQGLKVCVLEQHYTAGGFTHSYEREGYEWDVGVHYIGEVHKPHSTLRRVFDVISEGRLQWQAMDPVYDRIILGDREYDFVAGANNFIETLTGYFPQEEQAIREYVALIRNVSSSTPKFFAGQAMPRRMGRLYNRLRRRLVPKEFYMTTRDVLEGLTDNQELISVLTGQWGDYGQVPSDAAFVMHALIAKHFLGGGAYPVGGSSAIAREIIPTIQKSGGEVFTYAEVDQVVVEKGRATGVKMVDGSVIHGDKVVSNAGFMNTVKRLVPEEYRREHKMQAWTSEVDYSSASVCVYAGFKGSAKELGLSTTNLWIYPSGDHEGNMARYRDDETNELPLVYVSFPSTKDPEWDSRYPGKSTVELVSVADMSRFEAWQGTTWNQRGDDYEAYKKALAERMLEKLFERMPQLRDALDYFELSTPLSTQHFQLNKRGEIYGLDHFVDRFEKPFLHSQLPIKNLYMTGADTMTAGVGGALMSGLMTTMNMLGLRGGKKVMAQLKNYQSEAPEVT
ncbi:MAG: NAD(P)/FAD-dependent oxidoreductase [Candidatus Pelagadaptatus aseana]